MGTIVITGLILLVSVLLGLVVLIQNPKGGGLGAGFGNVNQIGGVKRTADFLEKFTWGLAISLVVLCLVSTWSLNADRSDSLLDLDNGIEQIQQDVPEAVQEDAASEELNP